ncbi:MAG: hypothetical protein WA941_14825 [Nitrososphaeraceae archaeon]
MVKPVLVDWKGKIVPRVEQILTDRRNKGIPTVTLRGIFYILVSLNMLKNLPKRYKGLSKALYTARRCGALSEHWIVDESREIMINILSQVRKLCDCWND